MKPSEAISIAPATARHAESVVALFERCDAPCYCQYFQFAGDNREWQMLCGSSREENAHRLRAQLKEGSLQAFIAISGDQVVGWMRLERPAGLQKRYQGRLYRGLPCFGTERAKVLSIVCYLMDPDYRRHGISRRLLENALDWARAEGIESLEAFPRGAQDVTDEEQWTGPVGLYEGLGFKKVHDFSPYPVYRFDF